jgi:hypothetical protein
VCVAEILKPLLCKEFPLFMASSQHQPEITAIVLMERVALHCEWVGFVQEV